MNSLQLVVTMMAMALLTACGEVSRAQVESITPGTTPYGAVPGNARVYMVSIPVGTELILALDKTLSSETSQPGDSFSATIMEPIVIENREAIPARSTIQGRVTQVSSAMQGGGMSRLVLSFSALRLPTGYTTSIVGSFLGKAVVISKEGGNAVVPSATPFLIKLEQSIRVPPRTPRLSSRSR